MKKILTLLAVSSLVGMVANATIIDEWDMNSNGQWQNSNNGVNLGGHYNTNNQQVAQVADDGTFIFSPTTASGFGGKTALTSAADLTAGVVKLSWTYTSMDWSTTPAANNQVGFRLWNNAGTEYVGMAFADSSDKVFAFTKSSANLGNLNYKAGRVINSLSDSTTPRTVMLELDYANSEIRMYADAWQWKNGFDVHTNTVDFASAGVTDVSKFQTYYQNWGTGDQTVFDNLVVEAIPEPATLGLISAFGGGILIIRRRFMM